MKTLLAACLTFVAAATAHAQTVLSDGTFDLSNYTITSPFTTGAISGSSSQCASCGNPNQALQIILTVPAGDSSFGQGFINNSLLYNPHTQGSIGSIDASIDKNVSSSFALNGFGNNFRVLLEQDGLYYVASIIGSTIVVPGGGSTGYVTLAGTGLAASRFDQIDPSTGTVTTTSHPDFNGDAITFGLAQITNFVGSAGGTYIVDYDNLTFTVNSVPEPGTAVCFLFGAATLGVVVLARKVRARSAIGDAR